MYGGRGEGREEGEEMRSGVNEWVKGEREVKEVRELWRSRGVRIL